MADYRCLQIGDVTIGGPLGMRTGLAIGSIFYDNHSVITDPVAGTFDQNRAAELVARVNKHADRYGVQMGFDVIGATVEAMESALPFVAQRTSLPILINATEAQVRIAGLATAADLGILGRCIFASLNEDTEDEELEALVCYPPAGVMILASNIDNCTPEGSCSMIESYFHPILKEIGVDTPVVDLGVMDAPSIGIAMRGIEAVREQFGYPAGCAFSNCFPQWTGLDALGREWVNVSLATAMVACRSFGGDFLHYGIIEKCRLAAHALGTAEVFLGFAAQELDDNQQPASHALFRMFKLAQE